MGLSILWMDANMDCLPTPSSWAWSQNKITFGCCMYPGNGPWWLLLRGYSYVFPHIYIYSICMVCMCWFMHCIICNGPIYSIALELQLFNSENECKPVAGGVRLLRQPHMFKVWLVFVYFSIRCLDGKAVIRKRSKAILYRTLVTLSNLCYGMIQGGSP